MVIPALWVRTAGNQCSVRSGQSGQFKVTSAAAASQEASGSVPASQQDCSSIRAAPEKGSVIISFLHCSFPVPPPDRLLAPALYTILSLALHFPVENVQTSQISQAQY